LKVAQHCLLEVNSTTVKPNWKVLSSLCHAVLHKTISIWGPALEGNPTRLSQFVLFSGHAFGFRFEDWRCLAPLWGQLEYLQGVSTAALLVW